MTRLPDQGFLLGRAIPCATHSSFGFRSPRAPPSDSNDDYLVDKGDGHCIVFAPTGAGKKRNILLPTLLTANNPVIVLDVKGELARESADYRRTVLGHQICILDPWKMVSDGADHFNPLDAIDPYSQSMPDDAYSMARLLIEQGGSMKEAYWDESAQALVSGLIAHVVTSLAENDRSFGRIWRLASADDMIYGLASLLDTQTVHPFARAQIASLLSLNAEVTRSCIVSVIHQHLRILASDAVQASLSTTTFDIDAVRAGAPLSIYLVAPPSKLRSHAALLRLWLATLLNLILSRQSRPAQPTLLLLDEIAQLGRMDQIPEIVTLARGYGMRCMLLLQSQAQLKQAYPDDHEVMIENCAAMATFGHTAFNMSRQMEDLLGDISADKLFAMPKHQIAVRMAGQRTQIADRVDYLTHPDLARRVGFNPMFSSSDPGSQPTGEPSPTNDNMSRAVGP